MSLQIWLPLNGNTKNYGASSVVPIASSVTFADGGKIGQKYLSGGTITIPAAAVNKFYNKNHMSFAFWLCPIGTSSSGLIIGLSNMSAGNNRMYTIFLYSTPNDLHLSWLDETSSGTFLSGVWSGFFPANTWTHFAVTYNGSLAIIYRNGVKYATANGTSNRSVFNYDVPIFGSSIRKLNDVRIYNHVLSPKEVEDIAKGLVLHYKLDNNGMGVPNLAYGSNRNDTSLNAWYYSELTGGSTRDIVIDNNIPCLRITRNDTTHSGWAYFHYDRYNRSAIKTNTTYTISFDIKASVSGSVSINGFLNGNATNSISLSSSVIQGNFTANTWSHIILLTTTKSSFTDLGTGQCIYMGCGALNNTNVTALLKNMRLTEGNLDMPWIPSSIDNPNMDSNIIYDASGYNNHGTIVGDISTTLSSPRYKAATYFPASTGIFKELNIILELFTIAFWGKHTATGKMLMGSNVSPSSTNTNWYWYGDNSFKYPSGEFYYTHNAGSAESLLNTWVYFVATYDGTKITVYRNSINEGNKAITGSLALNYLSVGNGYNQSSFWENGYISDFRLYATALTAQQVYELYNVESSIDNKENIYARELVEE